MEQNLASAEPAVLNNELLSWERQRTSQERQSLVDRRLGLIALDDDADDFE